MISSTGNPMASFSALLLVFLLILPLPSSLCFQPSPSEPQNFARPFHLLFNSAQKDNEQVNADEDKGEQQPITLEWLASQLAASKFRNVVIVNGAGVSVNAGIPDFRTPGTGLYSKLDKYGLPYPEAIFELGYFRQNPMPFIEVAQSIWPGQEDGPKPTLAHSFVALLERRGILKRVYTQNIDGLESLAGVSDKNLIECHGHFRSCSCISPQCKRNKVSIDINQCRDAFMKGKVYQCPKCTAPVKPDVVFFGEELPGIFMDHINQDMEACDLLIVMGTSLMVAPVATIPSWVDKRVPRLLINRELVGAFAEEALLAKGRPNLRTRDVFVEGDCNDGVRKLCELAGDDWATELEEIHAAASAK